MSDAPIADVPVVAEAATRHVETSSLGTKIDRTLAALKVKNDKLAEDNKKLKEALAVAKSSGSRIRRIPKKKETKVDDEPVAQ